MFVATEALSSSAGRIYNEAMS